MPTHHTDKSHLYYILPDGFQKCDHQGARIVSQKQNVKELSLCFGMYSEGCTGWTVPQALRRFNKNFRDGI